MNKEVLVSVKGLQFIENDEEEAEAIELVTVGNYHCRDGNKYIKYEESFEGVDGVATNLLKIKDDVLEVRKKGAVDVHMVFEKGKKNISYYTTPYGTLLMGIATTNLQIKEAQDSLELQVDYVLEVNDEFLADCTLNLLAKSR